MPRPPKRFFRKALSSPGNPVPRVINVDKNPAFPPAVEGLKAEGVLPRRVRLRQCGVEVWRGGLDAAYPLPALSSAGASLALLLRFHTPLIEPDRRISRIRLSEKGSRLHTRKTAGPRSKADQP